MTELDAALLAPEALPSLWKSASEPLLLCELAAYFDGKRAPKLLPNVLTTAVANAVQLGILWARIPSQSYFKELMLAEALVDELELLAPPDALKPENLMPDALGYVWQDKQASLEQIWQGINQDRGYAVPWSLLQGAVDTGRQRGLFTIVDANVWPCASNKAGQVTLALKTNAGTATGTGKGGSLPLPAPSNTIIAGATISALEFNKISDILSELTAEAPTLTFAFEVSISAEGDQAAESAAKLNSILAKATAKLRFSE